MGLLDLFLAALMPVLKVVFFVFNPALVGSMITSWFIPFNILITFIIGSALGYILIKITRAPQDLRGLTLGFCAADYWFHHWSVPQFRKAIVGDSAPLRVVQDSASLLGDASIPIVTLIVGANLLKGLKVSGMQLPLIVGIMVVRYTALPMFGVVIIKAAVHSGLVQSDPLYQFVLLLQFALPPAMNIGTITQLFGAGESECSVIMLWTYALVSVSLTLWSTFFMWLVA